MNKKELETKLEEYLDEELADEKAKNTLIHYRHVVSMFINSLPDEDISKKDFIEFKNMLVSKYKPKTVNNYIVIANKFIKYVEITSKDNDDEFNFNKLKKHYSKDALKNIKLQEKSSLTEVLEPSELKRMLRVAKKRNEMDLYYIMKVLAYTGVRAEELKVFTVENIQSNYIRVSNKGKTRNIIVRNDLKRELLKYCKERNITTGYIFQGKKKGTMIHSTTIYKRLKKLAGACKGIKISKVYAHSFRHLFAIKFLQDGGDISELADILGHSSIETTRIYVRTTDKMKKERLEKMKY